MVDTALGLFAEHGVSGTSLQMIADTLGVTKAAVYHQFKTKEDIVLAVVTPALEELGQVLEDAGAERSPNARRDAVLVGMVDLMVTHRRLASLLQSDPTVAHLIQSQQATQDLGPLLVEVLAGPDADDRARVTAVTTVGGVMVAAADPLLASIPDTELRGHVLDVARRMLGIRATR